MMVSPQTDSISFAAEYNDKMSWVVQDVTNAGGDRNAGPGGEAMGVHSVVFFFSLSSLLYPSSYLTLLPL